MDQSYQKTTLIAFFKNKYHTLLSTTKLKYQSYILIKLCIPFKFYQ